MFTGLIEETGRVVSFIEGENSWRLKIRASKVCQGLQAGDSVAVNGCCLTAVEFDDEYIGFDLLGETIRLTSFRSLKEGMPVNLERSLLPSTRMGGHFVSGHVDGLGVIRAIGPSGKDTVLEIEPPTELLKYFVPKGCIAVDGISLTVAEVKATSFVIWLIPHTLAMTNLHAKQVGDPVNLECDLLAKYVERLIEQR